LLIHEENWKDAILLGSQRFVSILPETLPLFGGQFAASGDSFVSFEQIPRTVI
jgi:hypothetical protein